MSDEKKPPKNEKETEKMLPYDDAELEEFYANMALTEETSCGFGMFKGETLQYFANKKVFVLLFGLAGCFFGATFSYFNGTITTMEKRFKFSSKTSGIILVGNDITKLFLSIFLNYYASKGHRPRWIAFGLYCVAAFCFLNTLPHIIYGSGSDAIHLTQEYGEYLNFTNVTTSISNNKMLCGEKEEETCDLKEGSIIPPTILFISQLIGGIGGSVYYSLGFSYMDDNIKKSKSAATMSFAYFIRMLAPAIGYGIVSFCLEIFISPQLTPTITDSDPRWLGAWWLGWIILGLIIVVFTTILAMFPKTLPRAAARRELLRQKSKTSNIQEKASVKDMMATLKRLITNRLYIYLQLGTIFCMFGFNPFFMYMPKYIEIQYKKSASEASFATGSVALIFVAIGVLLGGVIIQKFKPRAKYLAFWNTIVDFTFASGIIVYSFLGCPAADNEIQIFDNGQLDLNLTCNANCYCDYVKFSPVCSMDGAQTFISACHAGCTEKTLSNSGKVIFSNCSCIQPQTHMYSEFKNVTDDWNALNLSYATPGPCEVDCNYYFYMFMVVVCILKLIGSMSRVTNFLVSIRCVEERDKSVSLAISMAAMSVFSLIPSPIFFGYIIDSSCLVWGKTCTGTGNCWFFNAALLRTRMTYWAAGFIFCGTFFDFLAFKEIKDLNIFNETVEMTPTDDKVNTTKTIDKTESTTNES